jgi:aspartate/methionine/tyrosine aminotransferase
MQIPPFGLERFFARHEFAARHLLCASDCESMTLDELLALEPGASTAFGRMRLGYTESAGSPTLREAISRLYSSVAPEEVLVTSGAEEAIFLFMHAALQAGNEMIVHQPCYQSLGEVARSVGARVVGWQAREEEGWALDPGELSRLASPATRAVVLNVPHNPTGWLMDAERFRHTALFADRRGVLLFSDEVYRGLERSPRETLPAAVDVSQSAVSLGVLSKTYGLPGLRIGWIATHNAALRGRMAELKDYTTICSSGPSEFLSEVALRHAADLAARSRLLVENNLVLLDGLLARHAAALSWRRPLAGPVGFARILQGDAEELCQAALEQEGVLLAPGRLFGDDGNHVRLGFGRRTLPEAVSALERFLAGRRTGR